MMKRRNIDSAKMRRTLKKGRITEGLCTGSLVYMKLLLLWAVLMLADCVLGLRFEYLWPFWLLIRSIYDSFRYQGMAFSVFFVCITVTSDLVCFLFIPVQWLFFLASTYVWVQYVWHADRGICLPTVSLWLLFIYVEASVRLKELNSRGSAPFPFTLDLCRPFAAHCIGYPVVTLGFGVKSYVGYKFRMRKQREVSKENEFYAQLLAQALPSIGRAMLDSTDPLHTLSSGEDAISNGALVPMNGVGTERVPWSLTNGHTLLTSQTSWFTALKDRLLGRSNGLSTFVLGNGTTKAGDDTDEEDDRDSSRSSVPDSVQSSKSKRKARRRAGTTPLNTKDNNYDMAYTNTPNPSNTLKHETKEENYVINNEPDLEKERLKNDLRCSRMVESDLRNQLNGLSISEKSVKSDLQHLRHKTDQLEAKYQNLVRSREQEKQTIQTLEKKLVEEQKLKLSLEKELDKERKKKIDEIASAKALAVKGDDLEVCKQRRRELESETRQLKRELRLREEQIAACECELMSLRQFKLNNNCQTVLAALAAAKEKATHLEKSLSAENRLKQDLFSALGDAKRQLEIVQVELTSKCRQVDELRRQIGGDNSALTPPPMGGHTPLDSAEHHNFDLLQNAIYSFQNSYMSNGHLGGPSSMTSTYNGVGASGGYSSDPVEDYGLSPVNGHVSFTPPRTSN